VVRGTVADAKIITSSILNTSVSTHASPSHNRRTSKANGSDERIPAKGEARSRVPRLRISGDADPTVDIYQEADPTGENTFEPMAAPNVKLSGAAFSA
jgi:hypothetical protein